MSVAFSAPVTVSDPTTDTASLKTASEVTVKRLLNATVEVAVRVLERRVAPETFKVPLKTPEVVKSPLSWEATWFVA